MSGASPASAQAGRRPHTILPDVEMLEVSSEQLVSMTDEALIRWADESLGLPIPWGTPRTKILSRIVGTALYARDRTDG